MGEIVFTQSLAEAAAAKAPCVLLADLRDPQLEPVFDLAPSPEDGARAGAYNPAQRVFFMQRRALLRQLVAMRLGIAPQSVAIATDAAGAPQIAAPKEAASLFVSLAGRRAFAALALAERRIGVDIEILEPQSEIPSAMLHQSEAAALAALDAPARSQKFLEMWTLKEAYLKALRLGLSREPAEIEVAIAPAVISLRDRGAPVAIHAVGLERAALGGAQIVVACLVL